MNKIIRKILVLTSIFIGLWAFAIIAYAAEFEVTNDNVNIRAEASTGSTSVGSANRGNKFTIEGESTDSSNNVWYRVKVSGDTYGYIRSDLGRVIGEIAIASGDAEPIPHQLATVSQSSVRIRSGPSTSHGEVASIQRGTTITLTGKAKDASDRTWYQMKATVNDQEIIGFVRADLITEGDLIEMEEDHIDDGYTDDYNEGTDSSLSDDDYNSSSNDQLNYEIRYVQNDVGGYDYYLYDRAQGTQWKVDEFLELINVAATNEKLYSEQSDRQKAIIIILAVVIIILALVLTVLIFKIRDINEDAEMDFRAKGEPIRRTGTRPADGRPASAVSRPVKRKAERPSEENEADKMAERSEGRKAPGNGNARPRRPAPGELKAAEREDKAARIEASKRGTQAPETKAHIEKTPAKSSKTAPARKPQNFLTDDDEFEFEFLNIDE